MGRNFVSSGVSGADRYADLIVSNSNFQLDSSQWQSLVTLLSHSAQGLIAENTGTSEKNCSGLRAKKPLELAFDEVFAALTRLAGKSSTNMADLVVARDGFRKMASELGVERS